MKKAPNDNAKGESVAGKRAGMRKSQEPRHLKALLEMEGLGQEYWKDVDPDEFVRKLREGWE